MTTTDSDVTIKRRAVATSHRDVTRSARLRTVTRCSPPMALAVFTVATLIRADVAALDIARFAMYWCV